MSGEPLSLVLAEQSWADSRALTARVTEPHDDGLMLASHRPWTSVTKVQHCHRVTVGNKQAKNQKSPKPDLRGLISYGSEFNVDTIQIYMYIVTI